MKWVIVFFILLVALTIEAVRLSVDRNAIVVRDQAYGEVVTVEHVAVVQRGKLVVVKSKYGKPTGEVIGTSSLLRPGIYNGVDIELNTLNDPANREIQPGEYVNAVLYTVNSGYSTVSPQKTILGGIISQKFRLL